MANKPLVLGNGIFMQTTEYNHKSHLDYAHVMSLNDGKRKVTDMGIIEPFVTSGYLQNSSLYTSFDVSANRQYVEDGVFSWKYPTHDEPCYIVEDLSTHSKPGISGETFKIKVNKAKYDNGYIIAVDPHHPAQLLITADEIMHEIDGSILTVRYVGVDPANRWFPKHLLKANTKLFPIGTTTNEYAGTYSSIPEFGGGMREYQNYVGDTSTQLHYEVTRKAAYSRIDKKVIASLDAHREVIEMYRFKAGSKGYDLSLKGQHPKVVASAYYKEYGSKGMKQFKDDTVQKMWIPKIEALGMAYINSFVESKAIWGVGGQVSFDGKTKQNQSVGLFPQLNAGNTYSFNLPDFTVSRLENIIAERLNGRVSPFTKDYVTTIKVGVGMHTLLRDELNKRPGQIGAVFQAKDVLSGLGGDNTDLKFNTPQVTSWIMSNGYGTVKMELVPGLDPIDANEDINPMVTVNKTIGGHRLSSYMIIIEDITTGQSGNIVELVHGQDWDFTSRVITGKLNYLGAPTFGGGTFNSTSHHPGYQYFMEKKDKAYWVKDITKSLLIKPTNPYTGKELYSSDFDG